MFVVRTPPLNRQPPLLFCVPPLHCKHLINNAAKIHCALPPTSVLFLREEGRRGKSVLNGGISACSPSLFFYLGKGELVSVQ